MRLGEHTSVNDTGGGWCLESLPDSPLADFIRTSGEETGQVQSLTHGGDDLGKTRLGAKLLALLLSGGVIGHESQTLLKGSGDGNQRTGRVLLDPFEHLGKVLVLLANVVLLAKVDEVDNGLGSEKEERVDDLDLYPC